MSHFPKWILKYMISTESFCQMLNFDQLQQCMQNIFPGGNSKCWTLEPLKTADWCLKA